MSAISSTSSMWNFSWLDDNDTPVDASDDVYGVAAFGLANPENLMGSAGLTTALGLIIRPTGRTFTVNSEPYDPAIPGNFYASPTFAPAPGYEMYNPAGYIDVISEDEIAHGRNTTDGVNRSPGTWSTPGCRASAAAGFPGSSGPCPTSWASGPPG